MHKSSTGGGWRWCHVSQMVAVLPRCYNNIPLKPCSATLPLHTHPALTYICTPRAIWQSTAPPVAAFARCTHYKQFTRAATFVSSNVGADDGEYFVPNDPFKAFCAMAQNEHWCKWCFKRKRTSVGQRGTIMMGRFLLVYSSRNNCGHLHTFANNSHTPN